MVVPAGRCAAGEDDEAGPDPIVGEGLAACLDGPQERAPPSMSPQSPCFTVPACATGMDRAGGTRWVRTQPAARGTQRAPAVTTGCEESQVNAATWLRAGST